MSNLINRTFYILTLLLLGSCTNNEVFVDNTLSNYLLNSNIETGAVIACAASKENAVFIFFYPENGANNSRYYETLSALVDENDYANYTQIELNREPVFNGYLEKFVSNTLKEHWVIVTYEVANEIKISNPIKIKQLTKATVWNDEVLIDQSEDKMPKFSWVHNSEEDNTIYFEIISDNENNLLSGTYTYENNFQYYKLENVVLNISGQTPPQLIRSNTYEFTLMDVSEDNWVNLVIQESFIAQ